MVDASWQLRNKLGVTITFHEHSLPLEDVYSVLDANIEEAIKTHGYTLVPVFTKGGKAGNGGTDNKPLDYVLTDLPQEGDEEEEFRVRCIDKDCEGYVVLNQYTNPKSNKPAMSLQCEKYDYTQGTNTSHTRVGVYESQQTGKFPKAQALDTWVQDRKGNDKAKAVLIEIPTFGKPQRSVFDGWEENKENGNLPF